MSELSFPCWDEATVAKTFINLSMLSDILALLFYITLFNFFIVRRLVRAIWELSFVLIEFENFKRRFENLYHFFGFLYCTLSFFSCNWLPYWWEIVFHYFHCLSCNGLLHFNCFLCLEAWIWSKGNCLIEFLLQIRTIHLLLRNSFNQLFHFLLNRTNGFFSVLAVKLGQEISLAFTHSFFRGGHSAISITKAIFTIAWVFFGIIRCVIVFFLFIFLNFC